MPMMHNPPATSMRCLQFLAFLCLFSPLSSTATSSAGSQSSTLPTSTGGIASAGSATAFDGKTTSEDWRRSLPPQLRNEKGAPLHRVELNGVILYLLGSSHVSRTSCEDAKILMQHVRPDVLFVELCSQRVGLLLDPPTSSESEQQMKHSKDQNEMMTPLSQRGSLLFSKIQADYAKKLNVTIGGEFREGFQSALNQQRQFWASQQSSPWGVHNPYLETNPPPSSISQQNSGSVSHPRDNRPCAIVLGDRPVRITLLRAWESLRIFGKLKLMIALLWSSIWQPSEKEIREWMESILNDRSGENDLITKSMEELGKAFPSLKRVIIEERDEFMVAKLRQTAEVLMHSSGQNDGEKVILAVVGAGHCSGMLKLMQKDATCSEDETASSFNDALQNGLRPENVLPSLVETKKRKISNDEEMSSLVTDIVQFDYSYVLQNEK